MKKALKSFALALAVTLAVPVTIPFTEQTTIVSDAAAAPKFKVKSKTLRKGNTFTIKITNKSKKYTYTWTTSKKKVATVNKNGKLKAKRAGTSTIKCKITQKDKVIKTLSCKVKVIEAASAIKITNTKIADGKHKINLGEEYEFIAELEPEDSEDNMYWTSSNPEIVTVDEDGLCTALTSGQAVIKVVAAASSDEAEDSEVTDSVTVQVIGKEAEEEKQKEQLMITLESANQLKIQFNEAMSVPSLVNTSTKTLTNAVEIYSAQNSSGAYANSLGKLTASMSDDGKILTINSAYSFKGDYRISINNNALTTAGKEFGGYIKIHTLVDQTPPTFVDSSLDDSGLIATLNFSEPLDISVTRNNTGNATSSTLGIIDVKADSTISSNMLTYLSTPTRYTLSEDKKSLIFDLTGVADILTTDDKKLNTFTVRFSGIKDLAGNTPSGLITECKFSIDGTQKPQANVIVIERTAYNKITVTYSRGIRDAGTLQVGYTTAKSPDSVEMYARKDKTKVEYTLDSSIYSLSGSQKVKVSYWNAYNTIPTDTTSYNGYETTMTFRDDSQKPAMLGFNLSKETTNNIDFYNLEVTYSKPINLKSQSVFSGTDENIFSGSGNFPAYNVTITRSSDGQKITPVAPISYQATVDGSKVVYRISAYALDVKGTYAIKIPYDTIVDYSYNSCLEHTVTFVIG